MHAGHIFYLSILFSILCFGLIARWYIWPRLKLLAREEKLTLLVLPHAFRYVGLSFLVPGVVAPELPAAFALPAAYGDLASAVLALLAVGALRVRWRLAIPLVWVFNVVGTADFLYAFFQGYTNQISPSHLGTDFFIPTIAVPALLITHVMVFQILLAGKGASDKR